jgi:GntR family transcriptional regulator
MWRVVNFLQDISHESVDSGRPMCHSTAVTLFRLNLNSGESIFSQVVFAAKKALIGGEFLPGQAFPSVRTLAAELKIHPNTAHKAIQYLIQERLLENRPGVGTVVATLPEARAGDKKRLLKDEVQRLVVEAKRVGLQVEEVIEAIESEWESLERPQEAKRK